jgi:hypothetical protein
MHHPDRRIQLMVLHLATLKLGKKPAATAVADGDKREEQICLCQIF